MDARGLPQSPARPVPADGATDAPGGGDADSGLGTRRGHGEADQGRAGIDAPTRQHALEIATAPKPESLLHRPPAAGTSQLARGELAAALAATVLDESRARGAAHPPEEAVDAAAVPLLGLKGALDDRDLELKIEKNRCGAGRHRTGESYRNGGFSGQGDVRKGSRCEHCDALRALLSLPAGSGPEDVPLPTFALTRTQSSVLALFSSAPVWFSGTVPLPGVVVASSRGAGLAISHAAAHRRYPHGFQQGVTAACRPPQGPACRLGRPSREGRAAGSGTRA